jgi:hypothetical protein
MNGRGLKRTALVVAVCAIVGAVAGIAGSAAAPSSKSSTQAQTAKTKQVKKQLRLLRHQVKRGFALGVGPALMFGGPGPFGGVVHAEAVVPNPDGTGFMTVTTDGGTLNSVDGTTVHIKEATDKATYKDDVGIDVGSNARVMRNGAKAQLSDLKAGDHVRVITGLPKGNIVIAFDDAFVQKLKQHFRAGKPFGEHMRGHWAPAPGAPGAPGPGAQPAPAPGAPGMGTGSNS